jgi:hypothetical protein
VKAFAALKNLTASLLIIAPIVVATLTIFGKDEEDEYRDFYAGTDFPFGAHSNFSVPNDYLPDVHEDYRTYSGTFKGSSEYADDRRFNAFETSYRVIISIRFRTDVSVEWICAQRANDSSEWREESPKMFVKDARYGPLMVWGNMYFTSQDGKQLTTKPFLALFVEKTSAHARGILLLDRHEGPVFLKRIE